MPDNSSLVSLARGLAHNFNNSLTGISGAVQIALMDEIPETTRSALTNAMKSAERMANLVRQLLEFSRAGDIKRNEFPVSGLGILFRELNAAAPERFAIDLPPIRFYGDEVKILMMLRMLVGRAAEVLEGIENGRVDVAAFPSTKEFFGCRKDALVFTVADNGPAIPESALPHIFEPLFNPYGRPEAGNLKLAVVDAIVAAHGGWVECTSTATGTVFSVYLPVTRQEPAAGPENRVG